MSARRQKATLAYAGAVAGGAVLGPGWMYLAKRYIRWSDEGGMLRSVDQVLDAYAIAIAAVALVTGCAFVVGALHFFRVAARRFRAAGLVWPVSDTALCSFLHWIGVVFFGAGCSQTLIVLVSREPGIGNALGTVGTALGMLGGSVIYAAQRARRSPRRGAGL